MRVKHVHKWEFTHRSFNCDHRTLHFATGYYLVQLVCVDCKSYCVRVHHTGTTRFLHYRGLQFGHPDLVKIRDRVKTQDPLRRANGHHHHNHVTDG